MLLILRAFPKKWEEKLAKSDMELIHVGLSLRKLGFIEPGYKAHGRKEGRYGGVNQYCKY